MGNNHRDAVWRSPSIRFDYAEPFGSGQSQILTWKKLPYYFLLARLGKTFTGINGCE